MEAPITSNDMGDGDGGINHRDFALNFKHKLNISFHVSDQIAISLSLLVINTKYYVFTFFYIINYSSGFCLEEFDTYVYMTYRCHICNV